MDIKCIFSKDFGEYLDCPYLEKDGYCREIEVNVGNGDAWCTSKIEDGVGMGARVKQLTTNFKWIMEKVDEMHKLLCPESRMTTWQDRVFQVLEAVKKKEEDVGAVKGEDFYTSGRI